MTNQGNFWAQLRNTGALGPFVAVIAALPLALYLHNLNTSYFANNPQAFFGPATWPLTMVVGFIISLLLLAIWRLSESVLRGKSVEYRNKAMAPSSGSEPPGIKARNHILIGMAIVFIIGYGIVLPYIGFPLSTLVFLMAWFVLAGTRKPQTVLAVGTLTTVAMLYLFIKVAYMPLPRGTGIFGDLTIWLYEALRIY